MPMISQNSLRWKTSNIMSCTKPWDPNRIGSGLVMVKVSCKILIQIPGGTTLLCSIFSRSLSTGRIPDAWKLSLVVPVFKDGDPHAVSNYRSISLQPICDKMLEKIIHRSILYHLNTNGILTNRQFGFLPKSSTTDALTTALHDWYGYLEDRKSVAMALFDLSKAFDKVPHSPLLLNHYAATAHTVNLAPVC